MFSHSGSSGAGNQTRAPASWEPALASGQREKLGHWDKAGEEGPGFPELWGEGSGSEGLKEGDFLERA